MKASVPLLRIAVQPEDRRLIEAPWADLKAVGHIEELEFVETGAETNDETKGRITIELPGTGFPGETLMLG